MSDSYKYRNIELAPARSIGLKPRAQKTNDLLLATVADMLSETSFAELTVTDIARRAGVSPATFYVYFASPVYAVAELAENLLLAVGKEMDDVVKTAVAVPAVSDLWESKFVREYEAVVFAYRDLCVKHAPLLAVVTSLAAGRSNEFSDILGQIRDLLVDALLDVCHYSAPTYPDYLLDTEAYALLMFHILPLGMDEKLVLDDLYERTVEIAQVWRGGMTGDEK